MLSSYHEHVIQIGSRRETALLVEVLEIPDCTHHHEQYGHGDAHSDWRWFIDL